MEPARLQVDVKRLPDSGNCLQRYDPKGKFRNEFLDRNVYWRNLSCVSPAKAQWRKVYAKKNSDKSFANPWCALAFCGEKPLNLKSFLLVLNKSKRKQLCQKEQDKKKRGQEEAVERPWTKKGLEKNEPRKRPRNSDFPRGCLPTGE